MPDREDTIRDLKNLGAWHTHHFAPFHYEAAETIHNALVLLREQEPMKPFYCEADDSWSCGNCGETVGYSEFNPGGIDPVRNKYCPECGRKVKWDDAE